MTPSEIYTLSLHDALPIYRGVGTEIGDLFRELLEYRLEKGDGALAQRARRRQSGENAVAHFAGKRGIHAAWNDPRGVHAFLRQSLYDLLTELAQRHSGARHVRILFDQTEDVAVRRVAVEAQQQVRRGEMEKAQRVALHELRAVDQLAQFYRRGRRGHGHDRVARFGRRQQMAHRADAADARRDRRHFVIGPAFGEFFETAHLGHMKVRVGDMARIVQVDIDLGVPFDARDGVDDKFSHDVAPTRISPLMPGPACGPRSVLPRRRRSQPATEDSRGYADPP